MTALPPDPYRIPNNTSKYNALNAMQYPYLYGPVSSVPPLGTMIDRELNNLQNYALAYPISGEAVISVDVQELYPGKKIIRTDKGIGKAVETTVQISPESKPLSAQFYVGDTDLSLGSNNFVELGVCGPESDDGCAGERRMVYLRNIPTGEIPLFGNVSFESITGCNGGFTAGRGLIPGMLEDISELAPNNFMANLSGDGNFGGDKCKRLKLPVGSHIYDSSMKCILDYDKINRENTLQGRLQRTYSQVENNCPTKGKNPNLSKTWWFEEHCTPSYETAVPVIEIDADYANGETNMIPVAEPLFFKDSVQPIPSIKEPFSTTPLNINKPIGKLKHTLCLLCSSNLFSTLLTLIFLVVIGCIIYKVLN